ncbi:helix-turn-helix transcriptional regulator [bacterium]|nr:helix-turn-helix transcriptional regulator [bacterium]
MLNLKKAFGQNLKLIRKSKDLTQEKLSEMIDIYPRQLSKIETGEHFPTSKTLEKICVALGITPKELFDFDLNDNKISKDKTLLRIIDKFKQVAQNETYSKFVEIAIDSINDKKALEKLQYMIDGIKLGMK